MNGIEDTVTPSISFTPGFPKDSSGDGRMTVTLDSKVAYLLGAGSYSQESRLMFRCCNYLIYGNIPKI